MEVETLRVSRARECRTLYNALIVKINKNRLDTLKCLKKFILGHTCEKSHELESLIDQEINLLSIRNIPDEMMKQLRNRLKFAFFQFSLNCCEPSSSKIQETTKFCIRYNFYPPLPLYSFTLLINYFFFSDVKNYYQQQVFKTTQKNLHQHVKIVYPNAQQKIQKFFMNLMNKC